MSETTAPRARQHLAALAQSDEDRLLEDVARQFVRDEGLLEHARATANGQRPADETTNIDRILTRLGWSELLVPDGPGAPPAIRRTAIVMQELGSALNPTPLTSSLLATYALCHYDRASDSEEGECAFALDLQIPSSHQLSYTGGEDGHGSIRGSAGLLAGEIARADQIVCEARGDDGSRLHALVSLGDLEPGAFVERRSLDLTRAYVRLHLTDTPARRLARPDADSERLALDLWSCAVVLYCAEMLGALSRLYQYAIGYARDRIAFGRRVASYQAIKHRFADASLQIETACALLEHAVDEIERASSAAVVAVSAIKAHLSTISVEIAEECMQFFGAIGYTWEFDAHLYLRRLVTQRWLLGDPGWHQRAVYRAQSSS